MNRELRELFKRNVGIASTAQICTLISRGQLRSMIKHGSIFPLWHGVYSDAPATLDSMLAGLDVAYGRRVTACLGTAAQLFGFDTEGTTQIHIHDPANKHVRGFRGVAIHQRLDAPLTKLGNRLVTTPAWTAVEVARELRAPRALATLDAALRTQTCTVDGLRNAAAHQVGRRNIIQVRELIELADENAESPKESEVRLLIHEGELPAPVLQHPVLDQHGIPRFYLDFAWPDAMVCAEYDSDQFHSGALATRRDKARTAWLQDNGWLVIPITADDLRNPTRLVTRIRRHLVARKPAA